MISAEIPPIDLKKLIALIATLLVLVMLFSGCSASWHLRKARAKDPGLFDTTRTVQIDTLIKKVPVVDTAFIQLRDTLIEYQQGDVKIKYLWNTKTDSVFIEADCPDPEIISKTIKEVQTVEIKPTLWEQLRYSLIILVILLIVLALRRI